ncbi:MAG: hypothetical protein ACRDQ4_25850 [Pseudonocardiaceae bacterium]
MPPNEPAADIVADRCGCLARANAASRDLDADFLIAVVGVPEHQQLAVAHAKQPPPASS